MRPQNKPFQVLSYGLISLVLIIYLLKSMAFILVPIAWSLFLSIALMPLSNWLVGKRFPKGLAVFTSMSLVSAVAAALLWFFIHEAFGLLETTVDIETKLETYLREAEAFLEASIGIPIHLSDMPEIISDWIDGEKMRSWLLSAAETFFMLGIIPVYVFFLGYYSDFFGKFMRQSGMNIKQEHLRLAGKICRMVQAYLSGMLIVTVIVACMAGLVFYWLDVEYFIFFALLIAVFNLIPYIGVFLSSFLSVTYVFLTTDTIIYPLLTVILLWVIQLIENNLITPIVVGNRVRLNPLAVIIAIMVGGWIWGLSGIILSIPLLGIIKIIFDSNPALRRYGYLLGTGIPDKKAGRDAFF